MIEEKIKAGIWVEYTNDGVKQDGLVDDLTYFIKEYELDVFLGPEWLFMPKDSLYTEQGKKKLVDELISKTKNTKALILPGSILWEDDNFFYNSIPVIHQGKMIGEYFKRIDGGTEEAAKERHSKRKRYAGKKNYGLYNWSGYDMGVEICADHGILYTFLGYESKPFLDLYFVAACGIAVYDSASPLKNKGYCLFADGKLPKAEAYQKQDKEFNKIDHKKTSANLVMYELVMKKT